LNIAAEHKWIVLRVTIFLISLLPLWVLGARIFASDLGPDPAKTLATETGEWALRFLLLSLAVTPLRELTGWVRVSVLRRMIGLFAWFYAGLHFFVYLVFLLQWRWFEVFDDIIERPYITVGFSAFIILTALGLTSNRFMMRRLGRNWKRLHRLVYVAAILALIHLTWILRTDLTDAIFYGSILILLLSYRVIRSLQKRSRLKAGQQVL
jgi:methionine sulfoxide reductase heme-binding subunit